MMTKKVAITGVGGSLSARVIAQTLEKNKQALVVVPGRARSENIARDLAFFCDREIVVLPPDEDVFLKYQARNRDASMELSACLRSIVSNKEVIVITPASGAIKLLPDPETYESKALDLRVGAQLDMDHVRDTLAMLGYERTGTVSVGGQFSIRGGIIDIFTPDGENPYRIEFFGDEIESIRTFDSETQRSLERVEDLQVFPAASLLEYDETIDLQHHIWDYMKDAPVFIEEPDRIKEHLDLRRRELWNDLEYLIERGEAYKSEGAKIGGYENIEEMLPKRDVYFLQPLTKQIPGIETLTELKSVSHVPVNKYLGHLDILKKDLENYVAKSYKVIITASSPGRVTSLTDFLTEDFSGSDVSVEAGYLSAGMVLPEEDLCYISDNDIFDSAKMAGRRKKRRTGQPIQSFMELKAGEYVVHDNHGIGVFQGIVEMKNQGVVRDYIQIKYQGHGVLYVPVEQMDVVQKYIGAEGKAPKINRLGSDEWKRTRERAKRAVDSMMDELVELYAKRKAESGYPFSEDTVWQAEFEEAFPYEETEDQLRSAEEIKIDMEKAEPMDRLLCGDVGYGKTEVAARAMFKCLIEGKQAAMLVPTTILASQHYNTLKERFKNYPFTVELMSRFKTDKELKETAKNLSLGNVDLVIGTHRLLSEDVKFKDLGLLVIDEEQRFGVAHKEKIKKLKLGVDVLTLSATPIPRTLNMSLTGIRDMSLITEPPEERYPVQTYVLEQEDGIIREVIHRELDRGGQVFLVFNRVRGIVRIADKIKELVPEARVAVGHGQMSESALEDVMESFVNGDIDVLVATTIVESGLDIPNANTMVVLDADKFGLSQLYQLRGRVGRSNRIAYAYLMYQKDKVLTEIAEKRLKAVMEFTEFGAGFKIAMRDMELRGAGNVLGAEQSGHMLDVGYEMYARLVDEAAKRARGVEIPEKADDFMVEIPVNANIPAVYIDDEAVKLAMYKRIADIQNETDALDVIDELKDRFGDIPRETLNLIKVSRIRSLAQGLGLTALREVRGTVHIYPNPKEGNVPYTLVKLSEAFGDKVFYHTGRIPYYSFEVEANNKLDPVIEVLDVMRCAIL